MIATIVLARWWRGGGCWRRRRLACQTARPTCSPQGAAKCHTAEHLTILKSQLNGAGPSARVFETYGSGLLSLTVSGRAAYSDPAAAA